MSSARVPQDRTQDRTDKIATDERHAWPRINAKENANVTFAFYTSTWYWQQQLLCLSVLMKITGNYCCDKTWSVRVQSHCVVLSCNRPNRVRVTNTNLNNYTLSILSSKVNVPSGSDTILVFSSQRRFRYSDGNPPLTGASNARGYDKMTIFFHKYLAVSQKR